MVSCQKKMEDTVLIHGEHWKVIDIKEEVEWCRKQKWEKATFAPRDAIKQKHSWTEHKEAKAVPVGGEIIEGGWEHEHCQVCWWKIRESDNPEVGVGYTNANQWLCVECYRQFVEGNVLEISS
ncbi:MAG: hypothetical protein D3909_13340 [Candidatus Electrothrix sp. ATG1]|nr:hypothetical protein [Candidatus Electrothrix sp. ATG1]